MLCPKCSTPRRGGVSECPECGVIYSKAKPKPPAQAKKLYSPYSIWGWALILLVFVGYNTYDWWEAREQKKQAKIEASAPPNYSDWNEDFNIHISKALLTNKKEGCPQYKWKQDFSHDNEFLVACSRDGKAWRYYKVNTKKSSAAAVTI